ncbi:Nitronate monooxygenase [Rhodoplanes serenus]|uniref:Nitronate monooxygenase n=1 Tax=Rhodoplanes serenus TaxID=200615 RepID=A0A3S5CYN4_9BRAD|nr:nitronate monooxygenase [Rhodoplanes serenus]VCU10897.1 Nitronate monooxygenase [Rhodoplanes serenus]
MRPAAETAAFETRITTLFGIRHPILAGGLQWLADADWVAAAIDAGLMGFITAASFPDDAGLVAEIRRCRDLTNGRPFGVNVSMLPKLAAHERVGEIMKVIVDEGVPFVETSGRSPAEYVPMLKAAGVRIIHKVPAVRYALSAERAGVDAVAIVGFECGGHPGTDPVGTFVQAAMAASALSIPYCVGGGVGTGSQIAAALAMGADGVVIGTRFLVAEELGAHRDFKEAVVRARETDTVLVMQSVRNTIRILRNETAAAVAAIEARGEGSLETILPLVSGRIGREAYRTGDTRRGALAMGHALAFTSEIEPLARIVDRLVAEAAAAVHRLDGLVRLAP